MTEDLKEETTQSIEFKQVKRRDTVFEMYKSYIHTLTHTPRVVNITGNIH